MKRKRRTIPRAVTIEMWLFVITLAGTVWLYQAGLIELLVMTSVNMGPHLGALIAGAAFSTFVTTPFAVAGFLGIGGTLDTPVWQIALAGATGATIIDLLLVRWLRSPVALLIIQAVVGHDTTAFQRRMGRTPLLRWLAAACGGFLVAIPLPTDELGVIFFGASGLRAYQIAPLIFVADFVGIYAMVMAGSFLAG